jgi:ABC-type transport system involved in cytochrome bd biosynthesis fused ATPase/permease subunit
VRFVIIALGVAQSLLLAGVYLCLGLAFDAWLGSSPYLDSLLLAVPLAAGAGLCAFGVPWLAARSQASDEDKYRADVIAQVFRLGAPQRSRERTGAIVSTATDAVERAANYRGVFLGPMLGSMLAPVAVLVFVGAFIDWRSAGILAIAIPVIPLMLGGFQMAFRRVSSQYREESRHFSAVFLDAIQGLGTLRMLGAAQRHSKFLADAAESLRQHVMRLLAGNQIMLLFVDSLFSLGFMTVAAWLALTGSFSVGNALALLASATLLLEPLDRIGQFFYIGMGGMAAVKEIKAFLAEEPEIPDVAAGAAQTPDVSPTQSPAIEYDRVSFSYPETPVLQDFSMNVEAGEHVVLTGPSGVGKTTAVELLERNLAPDSGSISIFGNDTTGQPLAWTRAQLGVVAQHTYLFQGTLLDNLLLAKPDATDAELKAALEAADLTDLVAELPDGLETLVGERGLALSGGEAQRVAIARAYLKDAPILVLDEPTAHVDLTSERVILERLDRLGQGKTVLTVSHRAATIASGRQVKLGGENER